MRNSDVFLLAPKASEASKGAFYLFLGVVLLKVVTVMHEREVTVVGGREVTMSVSIG